MSRNRWRPPPGHRGTAKDTVRGVFGPLDGARIPGGCESCDAYQTVRPVEAGVWQVVVHHDEWCPWLAPR